MKIVVIGSGLIGVTSAYFLARAGHDVTVVDREEGAGRETSFANGALLTPSMADPWNAPGSWRALLASIGRSDSAMKLRLRALPSLASWGIEFLKNSSRSAFERNTLANLRLALRSLEAMRSLREETGVSYGRAATGTLRIFRDSVALDRASARARQLSTEGLGFRTLSRAETIALEPALAPIGEELEGAIHYEADETGDAYQFCVALADHARQQGVDFRFRTAVSSLDLRSGFIAGVITDRETLIADRYIVAAGSYSATLLRDVGVRLPVRPVKGYSVTFDTGAGRPALGIPIVDDAWHAAVVPMEHAIRVAGTAEFAGYDLTLDPARIRNLATLLRNVLPQVPIDAEAGRPWCGLRPVSADGVPIIGPSPIPNLWVNTGHGHLGWTMAAGSARLLADLIAGDPPAVESTSYSLARFA